MSRVMRLFYYFFVNCGEKILKPLHIITNMCRKRINAMLSQIKNYDFFRLLKLQNKEKQKDRDYYSLSPTDRAKECDAYCNALEWALANSADKDIKNIAIAGPYGSGKSSVIRTFQRRYKRLLPFGRKYKFLNISLANFESPAHSLKKQDIEEGNKGTHKTVESKASDTAIRGECGYKEGKDNHELSDNTKLQRLLELSIVQQLFYREKDSRIPESRFRKIARTNRFYNFIIALIVVIFCGSVLYVLLPDKCQHILPDFIKEHIGDNAQNIYGIAFLLGVIGLIISAYNGVYLIKKLHVKRVALNATEIEVDKDVSKSILNNYIDEIIYFFEETKYNVVVIEDLDRFNHNDIFTKLREINQLINSSTDIKKPVVFIYAIRDDMFDDKDRTKFFDFMIPIIPIINFSNSGEILRKSIQTTIKGNKQVREGISEEFIDNISFYVDDMRLLYNIINEFKIYSERIAGNLALDKLLSMIVYKNLYPNDFLLLLESRGVLYSAISKKDSYIKQCQSKIDKKIQEINSRIETIGRYQVENIKELRLIYVAKLIEVIGHNFNGFRINGTKVNFETLVQDDNFQIIKSGKISCDMLSARTGYGGYSITTQDKSFIFSEIEKQVCNTYTYDEREKFIEDKFKIGSFKQKIDELQQERHNLHQEPIKDLLHKGDIVLNHHNKQDELIDIMLRNGYIQEDYLDYISIFHEGSLTRQDHHFIIEYRKGKKLDANYPLPNAVAVINKLETFCFSHDILLNYNIVDAIFNKEVKNGEQKQNNLFRQLSNESELSVSFIDSYIDYGKEVGVFISKLCSHWSNIWRYIKCHEYSPERKRLYFQLIITNASVTDIQNIFDINEDYIRKYERFFVQNVDCDKLCNIAQILEVKFEKLDEDTPICAINFIRKNNLYTINKAMVRLLIPTPLFNEQDFVLRNYSYLSNVGDVNIENYIANNINDYVSNLYVDFDIHQEDISLYCDLLNNKELTLENKKNIIQKTDILIEDISEVCDTNVHNLLFTNGRITPCWDNLLKAFEANDKKLSEGILSYLNNSSMVDALMKVKLKATKNDDDTYYESDFCKGIIYNENIDKENYTKLIQSIPFVYTTLDASRITTTQVRILISHNKLKATKENYEWLRENFEEVHIMLLERNVTKFKDVMDELTIEDLDISLILKSSQFPIAFKEQVVNGVDSNFIFDTPSNVQELSKTLLHNISFTIADELLIKLMQNKDVSPEDRINIFVTRATMLSLVDISKFLENLGQPWADITNKHIKAKLKKNSLNHDLLEKLEEYGYISSKTPKNDYYRVNHFSK